MFLTKTFQHMVVILKKSRLLLISVTIRWYML